MLHHVCDVAYDEKMSGPIKTRKCRSTNWLINYMYTWITLLNGLFSVVRVHLELWTRIKRVLILIWKFWNNNLQALADRKSKNDKLIPIIDISFLLFHYASLDGELENSISRKNTTVAMLKQVINPRKYSSY